MTPLVCTHGSLARSCELCERDAEIVRLQQVLDNTVEDYQLRLANAEARIAELEAQLGLAERQTEQRAIAERAAVIDAESWRHVAAYYLGDYVRAHTPEECRREAIRRAVERR